jgi:hypothetical protein
MPSLKRPERRTKRYSSVSVPQKNRTTGTIFSGVLLVHGNQVQEAVIADYHFQSLTSMKLERDIGGQVLILLHPCLPMIDL